MSDWMTNPTEEREVRKRLAGIYTPEGVEIWLKSPHRLLDGQTARERIEQGGVQDVLALIDQLDSGAFS